MCGSEDLKFQKDSELSSLVEAFIIAREENGENPPDGDFTEGGLTDYDYFFLEDLSPAEVIEIGMNIAKAANGREVWYTTDNIGYRVFFGPLEEVKERVRKLAAVLEVQTS